MIAFKGFNPDIKSILGNDKEEKCCFHPGITMEETDCKTMRSGFHCCENPFECLTYYPMNGKNRFFKVDAGGNLDEDGAERIACTRITLLEELTPYTFALEGMKYMVSHMDREKWQQNHRNVVVNQDEAEAKEKEGIAIARGTDPKVKGPEGSILGLMVEKTPGWAAAAKVFRVTADLAGRWIRLNESGEREVAE